MKNIVKLFNLTYYMAKYVQEFEHCGFDMNGKYIWSEIEKNISSDIIEGAEYNVKKLNEAYDEMDIIIKNLDLEENEFKPKSNHFFMQLKNLIVKKSEYKVRANRILQIAFNAGQLSYFIENNKIPNSMIEVVKKYELDKLSTYINDVSIELIDNFINNEMKGGFNDKFNVVGQYLTSYYSLKDLLKN
jgi:hypothetical protein